jgi:surface antigen
VATVMGRHRRPQPPTAGTSLAKAAGVTAIGVTLPVLTGAAAHAAETPWAGVAACESGGDWTIDSGNGFYGGLQFTAETWDQYGGTRYAATANLATEAEQIDIAQRVLQGQGPGAWPVCSVRAGLTRANGGAATVTEATAQTTAATTAKKVAEPAVTPKKPGATVEEHTVRAGETLSSIAEEMRIPGGWQALYAENRATIGGNPNLIYPGERLDWSETGTARPAPPTLPRPITNRPRPNTAAQAAADWALQQVAAHTTGWYNRCDNFVARAYGRSASGWVYAIDQWNGTPASLKGSASDMTPPVGALVFWRMPDQPYGHVAIVVGTDGQIVTTNYPDDGDSVGETTVAGLTDQWGGTYLGWAWPDFL